MAKAQVIVQFWQFLRQEKKYWLMPLIFVFLLFALLMVFSSSTPLGPFIYPLF